MRNNQVKHNRRSIRKKNHDYRDPGKYFITLVTHNRKPLFGKVIDGKMELNENGKIVLEEWMRTKELRTMIILHEFVIMPDHFHAILEIKTKTKDSMAAFPENGPAKDSIGAMLGNFKAKVTGRIRKNEASKSDKIWVRNYYDIIVVDEKADHAIAGYIKKHPQTLKDHLSFEP